MEAHDPSQHLTQRLHLPVSTGFIWERYGAFTSAAIFLSLHRHAEYLCKSGLSLPTIFKGYTISLALTVPSSGWKSLTTGREGWRGWEPGSVPSGIGLVISGMGLNLGSASTLQCLRPGRYSRLFTHTHLVLPPGDIGEKLFALSVPLIWISPLQIPSRATAVWRPGVALVPYSPVSHYCFTPSGILREILPTTVDF